MLWIRKKIRLVPIWLVCLAVKLAQLKVLRDIKNLDQRIKILKNEQNLGAGQSRNGAIKSCNGKYIAFCDCDDLWKPQKLKRQLK